MNGFDSNEEDLSAWAAREVLRLAEEDYRRGVRFWADPQVAQRVRDLMKEVMAGPGRVQAPRGAVFRSDPIERPRVVAVPRARGDAPRGIVETRTIGDPRVPRQTSEPRGEETSGAARGGPSEGGPSPLSLSSSLMGSDAPPTRRPSAATPAGPGSTGAGEPPKRPTWGPPPAATGREADWEARLSALKAEALGCTKCNLCRTRTQVVFAAGNATVPLVFVGEAPGADEDRQGFPFVGRAGQLLTKIIEAIGLSRDQVYIANVLKCRPPENRNPLPEEMAQCGPYLAQQLELLRPKVICTLGLFASQYLLETTQPIGKLRGQWFDYRGVPVLPTYHPAALLRNPALKATVWEDVQLLRRKLDE